MQKYILNGAAMRTRAAAHDEIARALQLPEYYGRNLDALWDLLSTMDADLTLSEAAAMLNALDVYGCKLLKTFFEAARENPSFRFKVE